METYKVKMRRVETYETEIEVQAENAEAAKFKVERDTSWEYPDEWVDVNETVEVTEV